MKHTAWLLNLHAADGIDVTKHWDALHIFEAMRNVNMGLYQSDRWPWPEPPDCVVIAGGAHAGQEEECYRRIVDAYGWRDLTIDEIDDHQALVIVVSDEGSLFDWRVLADPFVGMWISTPRRFMHEPLIGVARFFGEGSGPPVAIPPTVKDLDVVFCGQNTHARRRELVSVLEGLNSDRVLCETTPGFLQGRPRADYLTTLARGKVAPCPSGAQTTDSFRLYEAIEAGCVPVTEHRTPDGADHRFWEMTYGDVPWPVVDSWQELPDLLPGLLADHEALSLACRRWWSDRRADLVDWLKEDVAL